jgi:hypothetical protein
MSGRSLSPVPGSAADFFNPVPSGAVSGHRRAAVFFLVIDSRFGTPIHVFLELDPRLDADYCGHTVREVTLESPPSGVGGVYAIGRDPARPDRFRKFRSDGAVAGAGFILIEPRFVGATWQAYAREFRPQGGNVGHRGADPGARAKR